MENPRDCTVDSGKWIGGKGCECVVAGVWWRGNGAEALADWIVRDTVEGVLRATKRAAPWRSVVKMNSNEKAFTSSEGRRNVDFEEAMKMGAVMGEEIVRGCGSEA